MIDCIIESIKKYQLKKMGEEDNWEKVFTILNWTYSVSWSLSFYGQIFQNRRLKSVEGMNLNFATINTNSFLFYSIYNLYGYFVSDSPQTGQVVLADVVFAVHAFLATAFTLFQIKLYPPHKNIIKKSTIDYIFAQWLFVCLYILVFFVLTSESVPSSLGLISFMGYFKLMGSTLKYIPQLYWNYLRKSTHGWSIHSILLDLTGGIASTTETVLQAKFMSNYQINMVKLLLGLLTILNTFSIIGVLNWKITKMEINQTPFYPILKMQPILIKIKPEALQGQFLN